MVDGERLGDQGGLQDCLYIAEHVHAYVSTMHIQAGSEQAPVRQAAIKHRQDRRPASSSAEGGTQAPAKQTTSERQLPASASKADDQKARDQGRQTTNLHTIIGRLPIQ